MIKRRKITPEDEKLIIEKYDQGMSAMQIHKQFFTNKIKTSGTINDVLIHNGIQLRNQGSYKIGKCPPNKKLTREDEQFIVQKYKDNWSCGDILKSFNGKFKTQKTISDTLKRYGITLREGMADYADPNLNHSYFDNIDKPVKAYILGLLLGDGWVDAQRNQINIQLQECDRHIIELIKKEFNTHNEILEIKSNIIFNEKLNKTYICKPTCRLTVTSFPMIEALAAHGIVQRKTGKERLPIIQHELMSHLIRGFFDADGSIYFNNNTNIIAISFSKSAGILAQLSLYLYLYLGITYTNIHATNESKILHTIAWGRENDVARLILYIYKDSLGIRLHRKFNKTCELLKLKQSIT